MMQIMTAGQEFMITKRSMTGCYSKEKRIQTNK